MSQDSTDPNPWQEGAQRLMDQGEVVGALAFAGMSQIASMTNLVMENLEAENWELHAQLRLIRERVGACFNGIWIPDPQRVLNCLYPSSEDVIHRVAEMKWEKGQED